MAATTQCFRYVSNILGRRSGKFSATKRFVESTEGRQASVAKAIQSVYVHCAIADEQAKQTSASIKSRQS